ncbi:MAG: hypothetical protein WCK90_01055 [archaeon]
MDEQKEEIKKEETVSTVSEPEIQIPKTTELGLPSSTLMEFGKYEFHGPESGDISIDKIVLSAQSGARRIWKVKSMDAKQIIFDVIKFG